MVQAKAGRTQEGKRGKGCQGQKMTISTRFVWAPYCFATFRPGDDRPSPTLHWERSAVARNCVNCMYINHDCRVGVKDVLIPPPPVKYTLEGVPVKGNSPCK